jgi:hypothetical protein
VPGTYVLVSDVDYLPDADDAGACQANSFERQTVLLNNGCMQIATYGPSFDGFEGSESVTYTLNGNAITLIPFCGVTDAVIGTYTATPTSLSILTNQTSGIQVLSTYFLE